MSILSAFLLTIPVVIAAPLLIYAVVFLVALILMPFPAEALRQALGHFILGSVVFIPALLAASFWPALLGFGASILSPIAGYAVTILLAMPSAWLVVRILDRQMRQVGGFRDTNVFFITAAANMMLILLSIYRLNLFSRT
ncbi:hypothetical protein ABS767_16200 [Sphingomonas sp. ST-64]|uniref:DUF1616 domain-containing protein n=1 Tax=Sphingomonas plantiphila TaxID=3163295 RepID=A0ABW8YQV7_9SPHN